MKRLAVFYATREGHTEKVARHVASKLREHRLNVDVVNVAAMGGPAELYCYSGAVIAASIHTGRHEEEMLRFVKRYREELERFPTAFLSVSLSEAGAEDPKKQPAERVTFMHDVRRMVDAFLAETHWNPDQVKPVAGALIYTRYNPIVRFVMKHIAKKAGADTDTSRDFEYTNWADLDEFCEEWAGVIGEQTAGAPAMSIPRVHHGARRVADAVHSGT